LYRNRQEYHFHCLCESLREYLGFNFETRISTSTDERFQPFPFRPNGGQQRARECRWVQGSGDDVVLIHRMAALGAAAAASLGGGSDRANSVIAAPAPAHISRHGDQSLHLLANRILASRRRPEVAAGRAA
jgi:hypothetical protein